jgi:hypothetical protein
MQRGPGNLPWPGPQDLRDVIRSTHAGACAIHTSFDGRAVASECLCGTVQRLVTTYNIEHYPTRDLASHR